ncbi:hypothetical protein COV23_00390 [Candidatus Wolfebacteria bacterium CG10_big_fil_rev_8_21_14_0_10_31_9]|uniref:Uncharacterized protein n=1 Tax=Candidatus Wolfebacteria bacterium CG10_big_fil_rev_8_21_14_0_10_31_9 TaxID=1975070 RepID=A0A2H0RCY5_9BACT|nr:MAG: hypothetical protein COV23_00390 [Candidatus Wolfebacteria bacterium CG10_big_fil_rev_8_21_14_0_10_31_9]
MDYSLFTEEQFIKRFNTLPDSVKDILVSDSAKDILNAISHGHYLIDEEKILMLEQLTALVLFGFLSPEELALEIENNLHVNYKGSKAISEEINRRIFKKVENDLKDIYKPINLNNSNDNNVINLSENTENFVKNNFEISIKDDVSNVDNKDAPVSLNIPEIEKQEIKIGEFVYSQQTTANGQQLIDDRRQTINPEEEFESPAILHKETNIKPISALKTSLGGLFGFSKFNQQPTTKNQQQKPIMAEVNIDYDVKKLEKEPEISKTEAPKMRIVNYSGMPKKDENIFGSNQQPTPNSKSEFATGQATYDLQQKTEIPNIIKPSFAHSSYKIPDEQGNATEGVEEKEIKPIIVDSRQPTVDSQQAIENREQITDYSEQSTAIKEINIKDAMNVMNGNVIEMPSVLREETTFQKGEMRTRDNEINKNKIVEIEVPKKIEEPIKAKHIDYTAEKEIKLEDIPVSDDVVDLRKIEDQ